MANVQQQIQEASSKNTALLKTLTETDYAPPSLAQQEKYIKDLESDLQESESTIAKLETQRKRQLSEHEQYRDSHFKRFAYRMGGKSDEFDAKASKEERAYFDAIQQEHAAKEHKNALESYLAEARSKRDGLKKPAADNAKAQKELDDLYHSIFSGQTPAFPEEDLAEQEFTQAQEAYTTAQSNSSSEHTAVDLLVKARVQLRRARGHMTDAHSASTFDVLGGGMLTDMVERDSLSKAQDQMVSVTRLVKQAQQQSQAVQPLPETQIANGDMMGDVLFDNIFSDLRFHDQIKQSQGDVNRTMQELDGQIGQARQRAEQLDKQLDEVGKKLKAARERLQKEREKAFEKASNGTGP